MFILKKILIVLFLLLICSVGFAKSGDTLFENKFTGDVYISSDVAWQETLQLVPLFDEGENRVLVYHEQEGSCDAESVIDYLIRNDIKK